MPQETAATDTAKMLITAWFSDDEASRNRYLQGTDAIFKEHGMVGATVYRSDEVLAGDLSPHAVVLLEWRDAEGCRAAFASPAYGELIGLRTKGFDRLDMTLLAPAA